jgi:hypothetical protein
MGEWTENPSAESIKKRVEDLTGIVGWVAEIWHSKNWVRRLLLLDVLLLTACATVRLSARDEAEINRRERLTYRVQSALRFLSARCETFDNQQGKDVKAKQH